MYTVMQVATVEWWEIYKSVISIKMMCALTLPRVVGVTIRLKGCDLGTVVG
jgi:hypothetical protein